MTLSELEKSDIGDENLRGSPADTARLQGISCAVNWIIEELQGREERLKQQVMQLEAARTGLFHASRLLQLGEMSTAVIHEINQPLNIIRLAAESLQLDAEEGLIPPLESNVAKKLAVIDKQVFRIRKITDHLMTFARKETTDRDVRPVNVSDLLDSVLSLIGEQLHLRDIRLERDFPSGLPGVRVNCIQLEQVFLNLITNARDAMESMPDVEEHILRINGRRNGNNVTIEFSDTAGGVPKEIREKIFEPFFTTKEAGKGTGLGLSVSRGIIREHGGEITLEVDEGVGSAFRVSLPAHDL